jgi:hypothetical protein
MASLKDEIKKANITPRLELTTQGENNERISTGVHIVKKIADKVEEVWDEQVKANRKTVKILVEEKGQKKLWQFDYLNSKGEVDYKALKMADVENGDTLRLESKKGKSGHSYVDIQKVEGEIPTISYDAEGGDSAGAGDEDVSPEEIPF